MVYTMDIVYLSFWWSFLKKNLDDPFGLIECFALNRHSALCASWLIRNSHSSNTHSLSRLRLFDTSCQTAKTTFGCYSHDRTSQIKDFLTPPPKTVRHSLTSFVRSHFPKSCPGFSDPQPLGTLISFTVKSTVNSKSPIWMVISPYT